MRMAALGGHGLTGASWSMLVYTEKREKRNRCCSSDGGMVSQWWRDVGVVVEQRQFSNWGFRVYKKLKLGKRMAHT